MYWNCFFFALVPILTCFETLHIEKSRPAIFKDCGLSFLPSGRPGWVPGAVLIEFHVVKNSETFFSLS